MLSTRTTLTDILYIHFRDPKLAKLCRETARQRIVENHISRALDYFPNILADEIFLAQLNQFESILYALPESNIEEELPSDTKIQLKTWVFTQIHLACEDMFNEQGKIKRELIRLLRWEDIIDKINKHGLTLAYISAIHAQLTVHIASNINQHHSNAYVRVFNFINKHKINWVAEVLSVEYGMSAKVPNPMSVTTAENIFIAVSAGFTLLSALGTVAFFAYNRQNRDEDRLEEKLETHKHLQTN